MPAQLQRLTGSLAEAAPCGDAAIAERVRIGAAGLLGEVIRVEGELATLQVYEDTLGLRLGEPVAATGGPLTAELGPGLLGAILDGVGRRLDNSGDVVTPRGTAPTLDRERRWDFSPAVAPGAEVGPGDVLGEVEEQPGFVHRVLVPPGLHGRLAHLRGRGGVTVDEPIAELADGTPLMLAHHWPVRQPRPVARRLAIERPFVTGQRVLDLLFPVGDGGSVAVPGGFGTGKTVVEQSLAKHAAADVVVFVGCGERGNEMAELLDEFPRLADPRTGRPLMERTVLVVNTSNMPVVAREASIYLGVTVAELYRDMGYRVALMVDSLSRWAEALREIGGLLQEMPGEEGYPTYLASRLGRFWERAGRVEPLGAPQRQGSLTLVAAVSPPGADLSEPVTQASLRLAGSLWALDASLAHQRHFPAVDWTASYSLYLDETDGWWQGQTGEDWSELRRRTSALLERDAELREIVGLVGADALQDADRLALLVAETARTELLAQNAFDPRDAHCPPAKTCRLARRLAELHDTAAAALATGVPLNRIDLDPVRRALAALRVAAPPELAARDAAVVEALTHLTAGGPA